MKANRTRAYLFLLSLSIVISMFLSCTNRSVSNYSDQKAITATDSTETKIDTSSWLKPSKGIRSILEDSRGDIWLGGTDFVAVYNAPLSDGTGSKFTYFNEEEGLCGKGASRIQEDEDGIIWIQAGSALCSYDGKRFSSHALKPAQSVREWESAANDLWFKKEIERFGETEGPPGVYRYHGGEFTFQAFPVPPSKNANQLYNWMTDVIKGQDGTIWFGTMEAVIGFNAGSAATGPAAFTIIGREEMGRKDNPQNMGIRAVYEDSKGHLWIGDNGGGVFLYQGDTTINFTQLHQLGPEDTDGSSLQRIFSIAEDDAGNMWFGTVYSGVWRFDAATGEWTNFTEKDGLKSDLIWTIYETKQGELLFGGEDPGGVYRFNGISFDRLF